MSKETMETKFRNTAARYGADIERWPETERAAARHWAQENPQSARAILDHEAPLDRILDALPQKQPSAALVARIIASARSETEPGLVEVIMESLRTLTGVRTTSPAMIAASLALLLVFGFASGYGGYTYTQRQLTSEHVLANIMGTETQGFADESNSEGGGI